MKFLLFLAAVSAVVGNTTALREPKPWEKYIYSPSSRNPAPAEVHSVVGDASVRAGSKRGHVLEMRAGSRVSMDFGVEVGGLVSFNVETKSSKPLSLAFSESPAFVRNISDDTGSTPSMDWDQAMEVSLAGSLKGSVYYQTPAECFRGGFRFLTFNALQDVIVSNISCEIGFAPNMPDLRAGNGYFYTADKGSELLNKIWYAGAYTTQTNIVPANTGRWLPQVRPGWAYNNTLGVSSPALVDGAKRDRAIWPGDLGICGPIAMKAFGVYGRQAVANSIDTLFYYQNVSTGQFPFAGPATGSFRNGAKSDTYHTWSLISMYDYAIFANDQTWLSEHWKDITRGVEYIVDRLDQETGMQRQEWQNDWARRNTGGFNSDLNALNYHALVSLASLAKDKNQAKIWRRAAAKLKKQYNLLLWDDEAGLYRDNTESNLHAQDGNSLALLYNLAETKSQRGAISKGLERNWNSIGPVTPELNDTISPFISSIELLAHLHGAENPTRALALLRRLWGYMVEGSPETMTGSTLIEGMAANGSLYYRSEAGYRYDASYTSHAHCWSAGPTTALLTGVLGLRVTELGGREWELKPQLGDLRSVRGGFETALGWFEARVEVLKGGRYDINLETPMGTRGTIFFPAVEQQVTVNGKMFKGRQKVVIHS
ncbi:hypothetical protein F66182_1081 [Fusarium sp. NRRL 66182]|nr:hypothetical protein F66182_1081 [Fusarium sp. NRRL 66182]